jgi:hypothetical protein
MLNAASDAIVVETSKQHTRAAAAHLAIIAAPR